MPIDFFEGKCKTDSSKNKFGLCDDPPPAENSAYINEDDQAKWVATVNNENNKEISFYAIDHCVTILRPNGDRESKCDGILRFDNNLIFVELKDRSSKGWLTKGREQLTTTIEKFSENYNISSYTKAEAYVCNKQRPMANTGNKELIQRFKDDTGLILKVQSTISV